MELINFRKTSYMKRLYYLVLISLISFFGCSNDDSDNSDLLNDTGILGRWEFTDETVNGISDLLPKCCVYFEFEPDNNTDDLAGLFSRTSEANELVIGEFTIDTDSQTITFNYGNNEQLVYNYELNEAINYLSVSFSEDDLNYVQGWVKRD